MTWLTGAFKGKSFHLSGGAKRKKTAVRNATNRALKKYGKTFTDLARYDRGEKMGDSVAR